jgi:hypothetical protein
MACQSGKKQGITRRVPSLQSITLVQQKERADG